MRLIEKALRDHNPEDLPQKANAAVLVPLFEGREGAGLVLIHRAHDIGPHSRQMGFPGGMAEPADQGDLLLTALRETSEEIGVRPDDVEIIGELAQRRTVLSNLTVKPFVGVIPHPYEFKPDYREVQEVYTALLEDLLHGMFRGENPFDLPPPVYPVQGMPVWGLTARMITELLEVIKR